jgi:hypothetical protein
MATEATGKAELAARRRESGKMPDEAAAGKAREAIERYGDHADAYARTRIEAAQISGEPEDVRLWEQASELISSEDRPAED